MASIFYSIRDFYVENGLEPARDTCSAISMNMRFRLPNKVDFASPGFFSGLIPIQAEYPRFGRYQDFTADAKYLDELIRKGTEQTNGSIFIDILDENEQTFVNQIFERNRHDLAQVCTRLQQRSMTDVVVSNIGTYLCTNKRQEPNGPFQINEIYYADSMSSVPSRDTSLIYHAALWNDEIMFMVSSDRARLASFYSDRLVTLLEKFLNKTAASL